MRVNELESMLAQAQANANITPAKKTEIVAGDNIMRKCVAEIFCFTIIIYIHLWDSKLANAFIV